jgi:hypothetical protein
MASSDRYQPQRRHSCFKLFSIRYSSCEPESIHDQLYVNTFQQASFQAIERAMGSGQQVTNQQMITGIAHARLVQHSLDGEIVTSRFLCRSANAEVAADVAPDLTSGVCKSICKSTCKSIFRSKLSLTRVVLPASIYPIPHTQPVHSL